MVALCRRIAGSTRLRLQCAEWLAAVTTACLVAGCATKHDQLVAFLRSHDTEVSTGHYVVRPPDAITIHAPCADEIDGVTQSVRADRKVVLRLLGEVDVAGLTTEEIAEKLETQLSRYYVEPEVVVAVGSYRSQFYYVFGQVMFPGPKPYTGRDTLLMALAEAQPNFLAWRSQIRVVRPSAEGDERKIVVDLDRVLATGDASQNVLVQEGDIIEVPPPTAGLVGPARARVALPARPRVAGLRRPGGCDPFHAHI